MGRWVFRTTPLWTWAFLRLTLGAIWLHFGLRRLFGWFGGPGLPESMSYFTEAAGVSSLVGMVVLVVEFAGAVFMILGFFTRFAAVGVFADLIFAAALVHARGVVPVDWFGQRAGSGIQFHLLAGAIALVLLWKGAGRLSFDIGLGREPSAGY